MSDQPKKQELPPIERMERTVKCCVCGWYTAGVPQAELLAALSDNEAKDARIAELELIKQAFLLSIIDARVDEKFESPCEEYDHWLARIREAIK